MLIDIHCHLEMLSDIEKVIENARKAGVGIIVYNSINFETMKKALELSSKYPEIKVCLGIYPSDMLKLSNNKINEQINFIRKNKNKIIGIGEVGIDLKENSDFESQKKNFERFIDLSKELDLPIIVHSRGAEEKVIDILEKKNAKKVVMHCFCGNFKFVDKIVKNGWSLSIPTNVTFSEHFQKVVERVPIENLFCETDSPFLHPVNGKRDNCPANVIFSYEMIAKIKKINLKDCEKKIEDNFKKLFR